MARFRSPSGSQVTAFVNRFLASMTRPAVARPGGRGRRGWRGPPIRRSRTTNSSAVKPEPNPARPPVRPDAAGSGAAPRAPVRPRHRCHRTGPRARRATACRRYRGPTERCSGHPNRSSHCSHPPERCTCPWGFCPWIRERSRISRGSPWSASGSTRGTRGFESRVAEISFPEESPVSNQAVGPPFCCLRDELWL